MKLVLILRLKKNYIVGYFHWIFLSQIPAKNFTKFRLFHQKQHEISFFSPFWLSLQEVHIHTPLTQSLYTEKGAISTSTSVESAL